MLLQNTITKRTGSSETALDQQELYAIGLAHVQRLARHIWTDYNVHDPGITILELLGYALTDLGYRAAYPIADLLASPSDNASNMVAQFFTARQILPNRPLTLLDYRKLLIDLKGVKNAWLTPASLTYFADIEQKKLLATDPGLPGITPVSIKGLYNVLIDYMDEVKNADKPGILDSVKQCLQANRNLCEDFVGFDEVSTEEFQLCAELELTSDADIVAVQAEILLQVQDYLAPNVPNHSLSDALAMTKADGSPYTVEEIFDGPSLDCGFILDEELLAAELRSEIYLSDIISIIMDIEGVQAIRDIVINALDTTTPLSNKWIVAVSPGKKALLNADKSRLVLYKRNMPVVPKQSEVDAYIQQHDQALAAKLETPMQEDIPIPLGRYRAPGQYYSLQNHFPEIYGLSENGLGSKADASRLALSYQLKGYLLFFDQLLANYLMQLQRVKDLFSTDHLLHASYFYQAVDSFANYPDIYNPADIMPVLPGQLDDHAVMLDRRNRFLDHLIARFAERFTEFANVMYSAFGETPEGMVTYKCDFLQNYPEISSERLLAYNDSLQGDADLWNSRNVSGLEKRLAKLLGTLDDRRRNLADVSYEIYPEIDKTPTDEFRFRLRRKSDDKILLSSSTNYDTEQQCLDELKLSIDYAQLDSGIQRKTTQNNKYYFNIIDDTGEVIARRIEYFDTEALMQTAITELQAYIRDNYDIILGQYSDEGMFLIENILLRPQQGDDPFLPICVDANCKNCADLDPYSYRIHIILPAYSSRFGNMAFRRYAEEVIREETPAHILPKICWISKDDMTVLEKLYKDWIYLKSGKDGSNRLYKLQAFIAELYAVKNVFPSNQLYDCDAAEDKAKFILSQTALGTANKSGT
jgi:hypothetical protein